MRYADSGREAGAVLPPAAHRDMIRTAYSPGDDPWATWARLYNAGARGAELNGFLRQAGRA